MGLFVFPQSLIFMVFMKGLESYCLTAGKVLEMRCTCVQKCTVILQCLVEKNFSPE